MYKRLMYCIPRFIYNPIMYQSQQQPNIESPQEEKPLPNQLLTNENEIINWKDCHPFVPPIYSGQVIKVYDGDTITIASKLPYSNSLLYRFSVRLNGIDTPEIKGKNEDEKKSAQIAKHALEDLILHKNVILKNTKTEKYGRILADVYLEDLHLNQWMLDNKYAVLYDGGTKKSPESWLNYNSKE